MGDQADRLLELGFQEEVAELVKSCPVGRQTLLFSATMNTKVDDLASLALNKVRRLIEFELVLGCLVRVCVSVFLVCFRLFIFMFHLLLCLPPCDLTTRWRGQHPLLQSQQMAGRSFVTVTINHMYFFARCRGAGFILLACRCVTTSEIGTHCCNRK